MVVATEIEQRGTGERPQRPAPSGDVGVFSRPGQHASPRDAHLRRAWSWKGWRKVRRQSQLEPGFTDELVRDVPGGERLRECIQCGACSAVCPLSAYMEYTPRRIIAMTRAGMKDDVLRSTSIWVCASCYACTAICPKEIPITELVYALKRMSVDEQTFPRHFATPILAQEFERSVDRFGRNTESWLAIRLYLRTRPMLLLKDGWLALRLMRRGRMRLARESVHQRAGLGRMLDAARTPTVHERGGR